MSLARKIEISDFSTGLISDLDSAELPLSASSRLENADVRNKKLETQPGVLEVNTGLNASFIKLSEEQFKFTSPSEQNCVLVHGTLSGVHKLYIRPYISLAGAWVDSWLDLTEVEGNYTMDAGTTTSVVRDSALLSTTTDYYKGWVLYNLTKASSAIITAYNATTKDLTLSWAIATQTVGGGDLYFICRNPIYTIDGASFTLFSPSSLGCRFLPRENAIDIVTGSDIAYDDNTVPLKSDLILTVQNGYTVFNDADLNFTGFHLAIKPASALKQESVIGAFSSQALGAGEVALPAGDYIVAAVGKYDGFQEGPLWKGNVVFDGTNYPTTARVTIAATNKMKVDLALYYGASGSNVAPYITPVAGAFADGYSAIIVDRRLTSILIYIAEGQVTANGGYRPASEWRMVKEVFLNSSLWAGSGPSYTQTIYVTGSEDSAAEGVDISDRQGHGSLKIHANANFIASTGESVAVANVYADEKRQSFVFFAAENSDGLVTPDVIPHTSYQNLSTFGIPAIKAFVESLGFYIAFGENILVKIDGETFGVDSNIQAYGTSSANAVKNVNRLIYFAGLDDCFYYHPLQNVVRSLMTGFVREAWRALSTSDKQAAAIGFDGRYNVLVIAAGTQIYVYNLPASFASDLAQDTEAIGAWSVYSVGKTFLKFYTDLTKRCIGIASDGKSYELFSSGAANTMIYEKVLGESNLNLHSLRLTYEATATVTAKIFDMARNETYPVQTFKFPAQSKHRRVDVHKGAQVRRPKLRIEASAGTKISQLVINPAPISDEK